MSCQRYDCYQINLQVKLPEEDSCLYSRYGPSLFNIRKVDTGKCVEKDDCCNDSCSTECDEKKYKPKIPDAAILAIDIDKCDCTKAIFTIFVRLLCNKNAPADIENLYKGPLDRFFESGKFTITSGASGLEREIITFSVNPLPVNVTASGVIDKCYTFEIFRVPCRKLKNCTEEECDCDFPCNAVKTSVSFDSLQIMFPLTKEIKCLVPDFGLHGTYLNIALGTLVKTKVRVVSLGPIKFSVLGLLTYDKDTCTVCLEISLHTFKVNTDYTNGYEHLMGPFLCNDGCCDDSEIAIEALNCILHDDNPITAAIKFFKLLASSKKLDVMGLDKCIEKVLFSFQLCYVPFQKLCLSDCGSKCDTEICSDLVYGLPDVKNTYRVQTDSPEYSYELVLTDICQLEEC
jgi:hypothetical protein